MNRENVAELEADCEEALRVIVEAYFEEFPKRVVHLMAKAAVTVLEAVVEEDE